MNFVIFYIFCGVKKTSKINGEPKIIEKSNILNQKRHKHKMLFLHLYLLSPYNECKK
jgi:hypothetical protein